MLSSARHKPYLVIISQGLAVISDRLRELTNERESAESYQARCEETELTVKSKSYIKSGPSVSISTI